MTRLIRANKALLIARGLPRAQRGWSRVGTACHAGVSTVYGVEVSLVETTAEPGSTLLTTLVTCASAEDAAAKQSTAASALGSIALINAALGVVAQSLPRLSAREIPILAPSAPPSSDDSGAVVGGAVGGVLGGLLMLGVAGLYMSARSRGKVHGEVYRVDVVTGPHTVTSTAPKSIEQEA